MEKTRTTKVLLKILRFWILIVRISVDWISDILFGFYHSFHPHKPLPELGSALLLESASSIARKIRLRELRSVDVVEEFISRIGEINTAINAVVADRFELARQEAREVDRILDSSEGEAKEYSVERKPFFGVPFTNKECIRVIGLPNTSGLYLRKGFCAKEDAEVVRRMREAGTSIRHLVVLKIHCSRKVFEITVNLLI